MAHCCRCHSILDDYEDVICTACINECAEEAEENNEE